MLQDLSKTRKTSIEILYSFEKDGYPTVHVEKITGKLFIYDFSCYIELETTKEDLQKFGFTRVYPKTEKKTIKVF